MADFLELALYERGSARRTGLFPCRRISVLYRGERR
jgi:hypothetical protein